MVISDDIMEGTAKGIVDIIDAKKKTYAGKRVVSFKDCNDLLKSKRSTLVKYLHTNTLKNFRLVSAAVPNLK